MKVVATNIPSPFDKAALNMYAEEFSLGINGLVVFPENSFNEQDLEKLFELSNHYDVGLVGTLREQNYQKVICVSNQSLSVGSSSYTGYFIPRIDSDSLLITNLDKALFDFYSDDKLLNFCIGDKSFSAITRICSDIGLPYLHDDVCDFLIVPSEIEHPKDWFKKNIGLFSNNFKDDSLIIYSPLKTNDFNDCNFREVGIYNSELKNLGVQKKDYAVFDFGN
ncbi:hypothetical protein KO361_01095 [Candidatus Woesearchaeota archaeon]|nr:hypothetical protein [Candidatus Woesearchaeota archaeon]